jgi:hypothetical protein
MCFLSDLKIYHLLYIYTNINIPSKAKVGNVFKFGKIEQQNSVLNRSKQEIVGNALRCSTNVG